MPEGGAYIWDAWQTSLSYTLNIVLFVKRQAAYGLNEGGSGRPTVLDHPLHISLFEGNFRDYQPSHLRARANAPRLYPPTSHTRQYPQRLTTVLLRTHGPMNRLHTFGYRGGLTQSNKHLFQLPHLVGMRMIRKHLQSPLQKFHETGLLTAHKTVFLITP
jgi:hypothetical protein